MANKDKNAGGNNLTRQHYRMATGEKVTGMAKGGSCAPGYSKGAKIGAPKRGRG